MDIIHGRQIMPKPWMHKEEQRQTAANLPQNWTDDRTTRSTELLNWCADGLKNTLKYLDYISQIDISYEAPYEQRNRYENSL